MVDLQGQIQRVTLKGVFLFPFVLQNRTVALFVELVFTALSQHLKENCWQNHARLVAQVIEHCVPPSFVPQSFVKQEGTTYA